MLNQKHEVGDRLDILDSGLGEAVEGGRIPGFLDFRIQFPDMIPGAATSARSDRSVRKKVLCLS